MGYITAFVAGQILNSLMWFVVFMFFYSDKLEKRNSQDKTFKGGRENVD